MKPIFRPAHPPANLPDRPLPDSETIRRRDQRRRRTRVILSVSIAALVGVVSTRSVGQVAAATLHRMARVSNEFWSDSQSGAPAPAGKTSGPVPASQISGGHADNVVSFAHGAIMGVLPSSASAREEWPGVVASNRASPFDREFAALQDTLHKASRQARAGRSLWRAVGDWLGLSGAPTDQSAKQTLLDPKFGEISLRLSTRRGLRPWDSSPGSENNRADAAALQAFEVNLLVNLERIAPASEIPNGADYARAPIGVNTTWSDAGSLVVSGDSLAGSTTSGGYSWATNGPQAPNWSGNLPAPAPASDKPWNNNFSSSPSLIPTGPPAPARPPVWNHFASPPPPVSRVRVVYAWNPPTRTASSAVQPAPATPTASPSFVVASTPVSGSKSAAQAKSSALITAPATSSAAAATSPTPQTTGSIVTQPAGLATGSQYWLVFVTADTYTATSTSISTYNNEVNTEANSIPSLAAMNTTWTAIVGTPTVNANDNTLTNPNGDPTYPIYDLKGNEIAASNSVLWSGNLNSAIDTNEQGNHVGNNVWTGTFDAGSGPAAESLGNSITDESEIGNAVLTNLDWIQAGQVNNTAGIELPLYALSGVLTAVPEPGSAALLVTGLLALAGRRRRRARDPRAVR